MGFAVCHPAINFIFFALVIVGGMCFVHPWLLAISLVAALGYYALLRGRRAWNALRWMLPLAVVAALMNPVFVPRGDTVLFTWLGGRLFTQEALLYGAASGAMLLVVMLWFGCWNAVMTEDKLQHLFAPLAPSLALAFSMTLRLVPRFSRRASQIARARTCVGKGAAKGTRRVRVDNGARVLSALTGWALEGAVETADSMRARGWGCGARSRFALWRFGRLDAALAVWMAMSLAAAIAGVAAGGARMEYYPAVSLPPRGAGTALALTGYGMLCFLPSLVTIWEEILWRVSRSKI